MSNDRSSSSLINRSVSRRAFVAGAAGVAGVAAVAATGVRPVRRAAAQSSNAEIVFSHIWGTPPGEPEKTTKHPAELLVEAYNAKNTGVTVISRTDSGDYLEVLQKAQAEMAAGNPPALVTTPWAYIHWADQGLGITNLEDIAGEELNLVLGNLKPEVIGLVQVDGLTKGIPFAFSCPVIYYNNDMMAAAGVDPAAMITDWTTFADMGQALLAANGGNPIIGCGTNQDWPAQSLIQSNGGRVLNDALEPVMDSPEAIAALQMVADLNGADMWSSATRQENRASFVAGSMPMHMSSIAALGGLRNEVAFDLQTAPFAVFTGKPRMMSSGGSFLGCYARDEEQQAAAWDFLKFAVSQEGTEVWMKTGYLNSTTFDIPLLPGQESADIQLREGLTRESAWPGSRGGEIQKVWNTYVDRIWANDISAEEGTAAAKAEIEGLIS